MVQIGDVLLSVCLPNCVIGCSMSYEWRGVMIWLRVSVGDKTGWSEIVKWPGRNGCLKEQYMIKARYNFPGLDVIHYH